MRTSAQGVQRRPAPSGVIARTVRVVSQIVMQLALSLLLSILIEWVGLTWVWPDEGLSRGQQMVSAERRYLGRFQSSGSRSSLNVANRVAGSFDTWLFERSGVEAGIVWLERSRPADVSDSIRPWQQRLRPLAHYLKAARQSTELFALRLSVLALSLPVFVLCALVGLIDGLVQRDLRRWGGGRESSFVYHHAKGALGPLIAIAAMLYLTSPVSLHPVAVLVPFALAVGLSVMLAARTFKKYL
ncbi:MAG TPA: TIGR03747 family integrating conjugative element membrane protein [Woeseiaceae bacterium]|nr:TIGR03747 family integrating conjugative element membrane protein [Woeseiaceae bacterium]